MLFIFSFFAPVPFFLCSQVTFLCSSFFSIIFCLYSRCPHPFFLFFILFYIYSPLSLFTTLSFPSPLFSLFTFLSLSCPSSHYFFSSSTHLLHSSPSIFAPFFPSPFLSALSPPPTPSPPILLPSSGRPLSAWWHDLTVQKF